jgi:CRP-like cAMP-binding protein
MQVNSGRKAYQNNLLASLPTPIRNQIMQYLVPVTFKRHQTLYEAGQEIDTVYFLEDGLCSIVVTMENGTTVEVGIIGRESFVGVPVVLGTGRSMHRAFIQLPGKGYSMKAATLKTLLAEPTGELRGWLQRGIDGYMAQTAQTAACNRVHELEERLARWLLMCHDRSTGDSFPLTHEFLAVMLGTRRPSVTLAAGMLQKAGLIECGRGNVNIQNRKGLEKASCECYSTVHMEFVRLGLF